MILEQIYKKFIGDSLAWDIASGTIQIPYDYAQPAGEIDTFPPAFIPMQWAGSHLLGYWKHWFCPNKELTIVDLSREEDFHVREIARNIKQFLLWKIILPLLGEKELTDEEQEFINTYRLCKPSDFLDIVCQGSDNPEYLMNFDLFNNDPPASFGERYYRGDFFLAERDFDSDLFGYPGLEIPSELVPKLENKPPWLLEGPKFNLFKGYLNQRDFTKAWLTINSHGWTYGEVAEAMSQLSKQVSDPEFKEYANLWLSFDHDFDYSY